MRYEQLMIHNESIIIDDTHALPRNFSGAYLDDVILIDKHLSTTQKLEVLAEEIAHYKITAGDIIDTSNSLNRHLENKARRLANEILFSLDDILDMHNLGLSCLYEIAEHLEISTECVINCLNHYKTKYGLNVKHKDYLITFEPLQVKKLTEH